MAIRFQDVTRGSEGITSRTVGDNLLPVSDAVEHVRRRSERRDDLEEPTDAEAGPQDSLNQQLTKASLQEAGSLSIVWDSDVLTPAAILKVLLLYGRQVRNPELAAEQLLDRFGSLGGILATEPAGLRAAAELDDGSITLLKAVQAAIRSVLREPLQDRPVIGSAAALMDYLSVTMRHDTTEQLRILFLDRKNGLIKDEVFQRGTVNHVPVYPRELVKRVLELAASSIIMVHNHPSGDPTPSQGDISMTRQIIDALRTVDVVVHDHVIVGRHTEISFRKARLI